MLPDQTDTGPALTPTPPSPPEPAPEPVTPPVTPPAATPPPPVVPPVTPPPPVVVTPPVPVAPDFQSVLLASLTAAETAIQALQAARQDADAARAHLTAMETAVADARAAATTAQDEVTQRQQGLQDALALASQSITDFQNQSP